MFRQSLAGQKSNKELLIPSELVSDDFTGIYDITLKVSDNLMQEDINSLITATDLSRASIFMIK